MRKKLLAIRPRPVQITVPGWDDAEVWVLPPSTKKRREILDRVEDAKEAGDDQLARDLFDEVLITHLVDEAGEQVLTMDDKEALAELPDSGAQFVFSAILNENVLTAARVEGARKN